MALLGKISAVLTASTTDFTRKIGNAKEDLKSLEKRVSGTRLSLDTRSLDGTLTKLQQFKRTLEEVRRAQAAGNGPFVDTRALRDQFRAFEDIGRPLTDLKNKIEGLSTTLQAGLYPELERIQGGFQNLYRQIAAGTTTFDDQAKRVESLRTALVRLGRATAAASDLGGLAKRLDADNSGASFFQPAAKEALQRSLQLRTQAEAVPARLRGDVFADLAVSAEDGAKRIEEAAARVVRAELRIARKGATPNNLAARDSAQSSLDDATRRQEVINAAFSRQLRNAQIKEVISPEAQSGAEKAVSLFRTMSDELRKVDSARFESLIASVGRVVDQFNNAQASASRAKAAIETLARANVAAKLEKSLSAQADSILGSRPGVDQAAIRKAAAMQRNQIYSDASLSPAQKSSRAALVTTEEQTRLERESFNRTVLGRVASLSSTASSLENPALAKRADDLRRNASELNAILKSVASSTDAAFRTQKLDEYKAKLYGLVAGLDSFDASAKQAAATQRQFQQFLSMSGGRGDKLDPALEGLAATIMVGRQYRGQFDQGNDLGKMAVADTIQRVEDRTNRILLARQKIEASTKLTVDQKIAAYRKLNRVLADQEEIVISSVVENSGGQRTKAEVDAAVSRAKKSSGSLGLGASSAAQLALQQGLFAIDDFMSSTGGFEYKLRAIGNNITQLGLLLGQSGLIKGLTATKGLFIALAAVVGTQAISAFARFASNGRTAEDQTKALNDSLARQKSLVEELAQAFQTLGDSIARTAFSGPAQQAREFQQQSQKIKDRQKEIREANVVDLDPAVQRERANQNKLKRELDSESDIGRRTAIDAQIRASREKERQLAENALRSRPTAADVVSAIGEARRVVEFDRSRRTNADPRQFTPQERERRRREAVAGINPAAAANDVENLLAQRRALAKQVADLTDDATRRDVAGAASGPENVRAAEQRNRLEGMLASIELPLKEALDDLSNKILESSFGLSLAIGQAQDDVADAIRRGVSGAAEFQAGLDNTARQLDEAQKRLAKAQEISDPDQRTAAIRRAETEVRDLEMRRDAINEQSRELRLTTGRGGERTTAALSSLQGNERFANEYGRLIARLRDAVDRETQARRQLDQAIANNDQQAQAAARAELDAASAASDFAASVAEAALAMEQSLSRIRKIGADSLSQSERIADDAQKRFAEDPTAQNRRERDAAEQQLINDRERVARANNALDRARSEAEINDPRVRRINAELESIAAERRRIGDISAQDRTEEDARRAEALANREAQLQAEREERLRQLTRAEQAQQDAIAQEIAAREKMIAALEKQREFDKEVDRRRNQQGDALRGLDLAESPAQRAARETEQGILDIDAAFREQGRRIVDQAGGLFDIDAAERRMLGVNEQNRQDAIRRFAGEQQRAAAPAIFALADSVANAVLQGPSRAALNVSDISTQEGARELNRLIRGEDSARDQNLIELQKQSQELTQVNTKLAELGRRIGVAL